MWTAFLCFAVALLAHLLALRQWPHSLETILILTSRAWLTMGLIFAPWGLKGAAVAALLLMPACLRLDRGHQARCPQSCEAFNICHQQH